MSDSHRNAGAVDDIIEKHLGKADMFIHLGDGEYETDLAMMQYPHIDLRRVAGNCDYNSNLPDYLVIDAAGAKIYCTHGHLVAAKLGPGGVMAEGVRHGCNIMLYGHTHERVVHYENGLYVLNPGSCSCPRDGYPPSYGIVDITPQGIITNIAEV
jgi:hypothetical protein